MPVEKVVRQKGGKGKVHISFLRGWEPSDAEVKSGCYSPHHAKAYEVGESIAVLDYDDEMGEWFIIIHNQRRLPTMAETIAAVQHLSPPDVKMGILPNFMHPVLLQLYPNCVVVMQVYLSRMIRFAQKP